MEDMDFCIRRSNDGKRTHDNGDLNGNKRPLDGRDYFVYVVYML